MQNVRDNTLRRDAVLCVSETNHFTAVNPVVGLCTALVDERVVSHVIHDALQQATNHGEKTRTPCSQINENWFYELVVCTTVLLLFSSAHEPLRMETAGNIL